MKLDEALNRRPIGVNARFLGHIQRLFRAPSALHNLEHFMEHPHSYIEYLTVALSVLVGPA